MVDLSDIVPGTAEVAVPGGAKITLRGITNKEYQVLRSRFGLEKLDKQVRDGILADPAMAAALIAAASGQIGNEAVEANIDDLPVGLVVDLATTALRLTFGPFGEEASSPQKSSTQEPPNGDDAPAPESPENSSANQSNTSSA